MQDLFIEFLPPWVETNLQPAFYDRESGTILQQTARMYAKINELIKAVNGMEKIVKEYVDYIDNYFKNLDVQDEINNKLDEMAEGGDLATIIAQFLEVVPVFGYETVADMSEAENLQHGCFAQTAGYYVGNDGGGCLYGITNIEPSGYHLDLSDGLYAIPVLNEAKLEVFGCYGDGDTDDTTAFSACVSYAKTNNLKVTSSKNKVYLITDTIDISNISIDLNNAYVKAGAVVDLFEIDENDSTQYTFVENINFDLDDMGVSAIKITEGRRNKFNNINIVNVKNYGIKVLNGYENLFNNINLQNTSANHNTIGFYLTTADSNLNNITMTNISTAFSCERGGNEFVECHSWIGNEALINESVMFLLACTNHEPVYITNCYCDTIRYFVKYNNTTYNVLYIDNLMYVFNETIYLSTHQDSYVIYAQNDDQTRFVNIANSYLRGLSYGSGASSHMSNRANFFAKQSLNNISGIAYVDEYSFSDTSAGLTLTINRIKKDGSTVNIQAVGSYNSASSESDIELNLGKLIYELLPASGITSFGCYVADTRWNDTSATPCYMYIPARAQSTDPITVRVPHGTGTKYIFVNISYVI